MKGHWVLSASAVDSFPQASLFFPVLNVPGSMYGIPQGQEGAEGEMTGWHHHPAAVRLSLPSFSIWDGWLSVRGPHRVTTRTQSWESRDRGFSSGSFTAWWMSCLLSGPPFPHLSSEGLGSDNSEVMCSPTGYDQVESFMDLKSLSPYPLHKGICLARQASGPNRPISCLS